MNTADPVTKGRAPRLVFVCQVFYPDTSSTSQLFRPLLKALAESQPVLVLSGFPGRTAGAATVSRREHIDGLEIRRSGIAIDYRKHMVWRALAYAAFLGQLFFRLLFLRRNDRVVGVTNPPFVAQVLWLASRLRGFRYDYMLHDLYPEGLFALEKLPENSASARLWLYANRLAYRAARRLIVLGRDMPPLLARNYGVPAEQCVYVPHWSPAETETCISVEQVAGQARGLHEAFVVQYSGNMGLWNDMASIVRAAKILAPREDIRFTLIGGGFRRAPAEQLSHELGLSNVDWLDFVPLSELAESLAACHCALISQDAGLEGIAVPCKLYGILASGRAIVAQVPASSEVALTLRDHACGIVVPPGDEQGLAEAIQRLAESPERARQMGERAFQAYREHYRLEHAVRAFRDLWLHGD